MTPAPITATFSIRFVMPHPSKIVTGEIQTAKTMRRMCKEGSKSDADCPEKRGFRLLGNPNLSFVLELLCQRLDFCITDLRATGHSKHRDAWASNALRFSVAPRLACVDSID